ncbi:MAG: hypothetical protein CBD58_00405 [bacterium TMED198]|nr:MAG: hypothetical protein CBD58_00405 [bacterium TMED198]
MAKLKLKQLGKVLSGSLQVSGSSGVTGSFSTTGNISGSSSSTGSFGHVFVDGKVLIQESALIAGARTNADDLVIKGAGSEGVGISIIGSDSYFKNLNFGGVSSNRDAVISYSGTSDNKMTIGTTKASGIINIVTGNGDESFRISGGTTGVVSGSSTSTGSFGTLKTAGHINASGRIFESGTSVIDHATAMAIVFGG